MSLSTAEASRQEDLGQFPRELRIDNAAAQAEYVHIVIFYTLAGRKAVVAQPGPDTVYLVCDDAGADSAAANCKASLHLSPGYGVGKRHDKIGIVVPRSQFMCAKIHQF